MLQPLLKAPSGACDCHMHIFDSRFPRAAKTWRKEPVQPLRSIAMCSSGWACRVVLVQPTA